MVCVTISVADPNPVGSGLLVTDPVKQKTDPGPDPLSTKNTNIVISLSK